MINRRNELAKKIAMQKGTQEDVREYNKIRHEVMMAREPK
jgi:uncharacterized protein YnzC (UPF0291/DUF896 family)